MRGGCEESPSASSGPRRSRWGPEPYPGVTRLRAERRRTKLVLCCWPSVNLVSILEGARAWRLGD